MEEIEYFDCVPPHLQGVMLFHKVKGALIIGAVVITNGEWKMSYLLISDCEIAWEGSTLKSVLDKFKTYYDPARMRIVKISSEWSIRKDSKGKYHKEKCGY